MPQTETIKTLGDYFSDWQAEVFGFGYGSGEPFIIPALREFLCRCPAEGNYDHAECDSEKQHHGGTWYTIGYAEKRRKPTIIVWPNGEISDSRKSMVLS